MEPNLLAAILFFVAGSVLFVQGIKPGQTRKGLFIGSAVAADLLGVVALLAF
ncbi:hypothetical protein ACFFJY_05375 [Fictibacillus aquaticus]|uniref:hypothetical protein n=1 Tax=Fictibacillus aquaticus TaxID=2021314 RepID=UPI0013FE4A21|nr:hypothetical protein [Fictibacillus aquaticus]